MNEDRISVLLAKETIKGNFFGYLFSRIKREEIENIETIGISYNADNEYVLSYNKNFINGAEDIDILLLLAHEGLHIMGYHLPLYLKMYKDDNPEYNELLNIGMDMAVNSQLNFPYLMKLSNGEELNFHHPSDKKFPLKQSCEFYIDELLKEYEEKENNKKNEEQNNKNNNQDGKEKEKENEENEENENSSLEDLKNSNNGEENELGKNERNDGNELDKNETNSGKNSNDDKKDLGNDETNSNLSNDSDITNDDISDRSSVAGDEKGNIQNEGSKIEKPGTFDDHKNWDNNSGEDKENFSDNSLARNLEEYTKDIVMDVAKSFTRDKGNMPGFLQKFINDLENPSLPYYRIIQKMVEGSKLAKTKISYSKINRKRIYTIAEDNIFITPFPGKSLDKSFKIVICIDTSGSFTKDDLMESLSGIKHIIEKDKNCEITVIEIDTKIHKEYTVKRISDIDYDILGGGGTILLPALIRSKKLKADCVIFFTDGYCENLNEVSTSLIPKKLIWILTRDGKSDYINRTGFIVKLPPKK